MGRYGQKIGITAARRSGSGFLLFQSWLIDRATDPAPSPSILHGPVQQLDALRQLALQQRQIDAVRDHAEALGEGRRPVLIHGNKAGVGRACCGRRRGDRPPRGAGFLNSPGMPMKLVRSKWPSQNTSTPSTAAIASTPRPPCGLDLADHQRARVRRRDLVGGRAALVVVVRHAEGGATPAGRRVAGMATFSCACSGDSTIGTMIPNIPASSMLAIKW